MTTYTYKDNRFHKLCHLLLLESGRLVSVQPWATAPSWEVSASGILEADKEFAAMSGLRATAPNVGCMAEAVPPTIARYVRSIGCNEKCQTFNETRARERKAARSPAA